MGDETERLAPPPWEAQPYRLFSLGDLMALLKAVEAVEMIECIRRLKSTWWPAGDDAASKITFRDGALNDLGRIVTIARALSLRIAGQIATDAVSVIEQLTARHYELCELDRRAIELERAAILEMADVKLIHIRAAELYEAKYPFGEAANTAFPSTTYDCTEAAKCLALARGTACVFHLMRALELVVGLLAVKVEVDAGPADSQQTILDRISKKVGDLNKSATRASKTPERVAELESYSALAAQLNFAKDAWRNSVAHARTKYTEEEARGIYDTVGRIMKEAAKTLTEPPSELEAFLRGLTLQRLFEDGPSDLGPSSSSSSSSLPEASPEA